MELPSSWHLTVKHRDGGKCDVMGKDDAGREYKVRSCDSPQPTERDVSEIATADRERYASRDAGARAFVAGLVEDGKKRSLAQEQQFSDDLEEAALPVVRAGFGRERSTVGYSRCYAHQYDRAFGGK